MAYQCGELQGSVQEVYNPRLKLELTPRFLEKIESKISCEHSEWNKNVQIYQNKVGLDKFKKPCKIQALKLKIGSWEHEATHINLVAKFLYRRREINWEIVDGALKRQVQIKWDQVKAIKATFTEGQPDMLHIQLKHRPQFHRETETKQSMHTMWDDTPDFTGGHALTYSTHVVTFPEGTLGQPFDNLMYSDRRLHLLNQWAPCPNSNSQFDMGYI